MPPAADDERAIDTTRHPARIAGMFDAIAPRYDFLNRLLSAGFDRRWRARALAALELSGRETLLDVCTGTADLAIGALSGRRHAARAIGVDFAAAMLAIGRDKRRRARLDRSLALVRADASALPIRDGSVDAAAMAFGIRNVEDPLRACRELFRVLAPSGRLAILEFSIPRTPGLRGMYLWYFRHVLPIIGRAVSKHREAYSYLPASVADFPPPGRFMDLLADAGFTRIRAIPLTFGVVQLYLAQKRAGV